MAGRRPPGIWRPGIRLLSALLLISLVLVFFSGPEGLRIDEPKNGILVDQPFVTVRGLSEPGVAIMRDVAVRVDPVVAQADENGVWECSWYLMPGENTVRLYAEGKENHRWILVYYTGTEEWDATILISGCST